MSAFGVELGCSVLDWRWLGTRIAQPHQRPSERRDFFVGSGELWEHCGNIQAWNIHRYKRTYFCQSRGQRCAAPQYPRRFFTQTFLVAPPCTRALLSRRKRGRSRGFVVISWATGAGGIRSQNLQAMGGALLLPVTTAALAAAIFAADTITDLEIAVPVFYTAIILLSVGFCKKSGIVFVGVGCIALTLLSDLLTVNTGVSEAGVINTALSLLAITSTTFLAVKIQSSKIAASEAQSQLAHVVRVTTLGELAASIAHEVNQPLAAAVINGNACLEWLAAHPPNFDEAKRLLLSSGLAVTVEPDLELAVEQTLAVLAGKGAQRG